MIDMTLLSSLVLGLDSAINITKALRSADVSINEVSLKLQLVDLMNALVDSKFHIADIKNILIEKQNTIDMLESQIKEIYSKDKPVVKVGCYVFTGDANLYCTACWDNNMKRIRVIKNIRFPNKRECPICKAEFGELDNSS